MVFASGMVLGMSRTVELDERMLLALAHPLRLRLLGRLRSEGPATASQLAHRVGESSGLTSYHLRKLAEVGLVAEDVERGTRRDRWWQASHEGTTWSTGDFIGNPEAHRASVALRKEILRWQWRLLHQWLAEEGGWDRAWVDAAGVSDTVLTLTPTAARSLTEEIWAVVTRYRDNPPPDDAADTSRVVWLSHLVPFRGELPL